MSIYAPTVVTVSWIQELYIETEGSILSICVQHHESTETAFNIEINFPDTEGGYRIKRVAISDSCFLIHKIIIDMEISPSTLTFSPGGSSDSVCAEVTLATDDRLEDMEIFGLFLTSPNASRILLGSPDTTFVHIINIDGNM